MSETWAKIGLPCKIYEFFLLNTKSNTTKILAYLERTQKTDYVKNSAL